MKQIFSILIILFSTLRADAQHRVQLQFQDNQQLPISYVTIFSADNRVYAMSGVDGVWEMTVSDTASIDLHAEVIGYQAAIISIPHLRGDTAMIITLNPLMEYLEDVTVVAEKPDVRKMKVKSAGYFRGNHGGQMVFRTQTKVGVLIPMEKTSTKKILKAVNFQLINSKKIVNKKDIAIEIKIYTIKNGKLSNEPINTKPIYLPFSEVGKRNRVDIEEFIYIQDHDVFVSLEFPEYELKSNDDYVKVRFTRSKSKRDKNFSYFNTSKTPFWTNFNVNNTTGKLLRDPNPKYADLHNRDDFSIGITYYEER